MCQASTPWHQLSVGAWANSQGHGTSHLQTSNQSPCTCHSGTSTCWLGSDKGLFPPFSCTTTLGHSLPVEMMALSGTRCTLTSEVCAHRGAGFREIGLLGSPSPFRCYKPRVRQTLSYSG